MIASEKESGRHDDRASSLLVHWPAWAEHVRESLLAEALKGESIWIGAPRHFGKGRAILTLLSSVREVRGCATVCIGADIISAASVPNWGAAQAECKKVLKGNLPNFEAKSGGDFSNWLVLALKENSEVSLCIGVLGSRTNHEDAYFEFVGYLHSALWRVGSVDNLGALRLQILLGDEYALWHDERLTIHGSPWKLFTQKAIPFLEKTDIEWLYRKTNLHLSKSAIQTLFEVTGGHPALVEQVLEGPPHELTTPRCRGKTRALAMIQYLAGSPLVTTLREALARTPDLRTEALKYSSPRLFSPHATPLALPMKQLGLLKLFRSSEAILCGSLINGLVSSLPSASEGRITEPQTTGSAQSSPAEKHTDGECLVLLHLSDLHFGSEHRWRMSESVMSRQKRSLLEMLEEDLGRLGLLGKVDAVVVTGDFAQGGEPSELRMAKRFIKNLLTSLELGRQCLIGVCGNHDLKLTSPADGEPDNLGGADRSAWEFFAEDMLGSSKVIHWIQVASKSGHLILQIAGIDSCEITGPATSGLGFVTTRVLTDLQQSLDKGITSVAGSASVLRVLGLHHHVLPVVSHSVTDVLRGNSPSVMLNSAEILGWALRNGFTAVLHGHHHQPFAASFGYVSHGAPLGKLLVFGAGSCGVRREKLDAFSRNHYFIHVIRRESWEVLSRSLSDDGLSYHEHWTRIIPITNRTRRAHPGPLAQE